MKIILSLYSKAVVLVTVLLLTITSSVNAQQPSIITFTPTSGAVGTLVTIVGNNISNATSVTIGGVPAIKVSINGDTVVAMVMPYAVTGVVSVTTAQGSDSSTASFTVTPTPYPAIQQGGKLVGKGWIGNPEQGSAVAISADGNTAIIGGLNDNNGLGGVWIFTRNGNVWTQQGNELIGNGFITNTKGLGVKQGWAVALSADGNTALVGGPYDNDEGAVWVFIRRGGVWTQQGNKLVGSGSVSTVDDMSYQGSSVSLSADGNTAVFGGDGDNNGLGAVWVFTRTNGIWTQEGSKLVGSGLSNASQVYQGNAVAISADGKTIIVGGRFDSFPLGAAWIFTNDNGIWTQQGNKLVGSGSIVGSMFVEEGWAVAISADGNTAIISGEGDNNFQGAVWVFVRNKGIWTQQGDKLTASGGVGPLVFGSSVSLSADGNTLIVGGPNDNNNIGATWVFTRQRNVWSQQGNKLVGSGWVQSSGFFSLVEQGSSVAVSATGSTAIAGGANDNSIGAAWVFGTTPTPPPPSILSFTPNATCPGTSIPVFITGANLEGVTAVTVGGAAVDSFTVNDSSSITAYISKGTTGKIAVTSPNGTATSDSVFTFGLGHTAYAYVANSLSNTIYVINTTTNKVKDTITISGSVPWSVSVALDGTRAYFVTPQSNIVSVINTLTNNLVSTIQVSGNPNGIVVSPDGKYIYVTSLFNDLVNVINTASGTITATIPVGSTPIGICISPDGKSVYVTNQFDNTVTVINTTTNTTLTTIKVGGLPQGICISSDGKYLYTVNENDGTISIISTATNTAIATVGVGFDPNSICITPDGTKLYVTNYGSNTVSVIDALAKRLIATVPVGNRPWGLSVTPDGTKVYVARSTTDSVSIINTSTDAVTAIIAIGNESVSFGNFIANVPTPCTTPPPPTILSFTPNGTCPGTSIPVFITGANLENATAVTVGGAAVDSFTVNDSTSITAYISKGTTGKIAVTSPNGTSISDSTFTFGIHYTPYAYIVNAQNGNFTLINTPTDTIKPTNMPNVTGGWNVTASPDGTSVYVTNLNGQIYKVNTATNTATVLHDFGPNSGPDGADISPDGTMLYVAHYVGRDTLSVLNTTTGNIINTIPVGGYGAGVCVSPDGSRIVAVNYNDNTVSIINSQTNTVIATLPVGSQPHAVCISPDGSTAYVDGWASNLVTVINLNNNTVIANIPVGSEPIGVCISADGQNVYVTNYNDHTVSVISTATNTVTTTIPIATGKGSWGGCISPDGTQLIVANTLSNNIAIISTKTNTVTQIITSTGSIPGSLGKFIANVPTVSASTTNDTICAGSSFTFNGTNYTTAGTYTAHLMNSVGCDSTATLILTIKDSSSSTTTATICQGNSFTFNGKTYDSVGIYRAHLMNTVGCDSTATLVLSINQPTTSTTDTSICQGNTFTFNNITYDSSGTFISHLINSAGCDSTATLVLTVRNPDTSYTKGSFCKTPYIFNGNSYDSVGTFTAHLTTVAGCDSIAILTLTKDSSQNLLGIGTELNQVCLNQFDTLTDMTLGGTWKSLDPTIASIDSIGTVNGVSVGLVKGLSVGTANITYTVSSSCGTETTPPQAIQVIGIKPTVDTIIHNATCINPESGSVALSIIGSEGPYQDSINGNWYTVYDTLTNLGAGSYSIYIKNSLGCMVDTLPDVTISVIDDASCYALYVPTGFVPTTTNPTGATKLLKPFGGSSAVQAITFRVYNRFGGLVFESHDLVSGWDGTINGTLQDTGTYVWMLEYTINNTRKFDKGTSTLIR